MPFRALTDARSAAVRRSPISAERASCVYGRNRRAITWTVASRSRHPRGRLRGHSRLRISARGFRAVLARYSRPRRPSAAYKLVRRFARLHRGHASQNADLQLQIHYEWEEPATCRRLFTVSFAQHAPSISAGIQLSLEADTVDGDPRDEGLFHFERHASVERCSVVQIADVARWGVIAEVFVIAKHDTTRSHGRWSVRRQMARDLPDAYQFLLTGRTSGDL